jgi:hypothetical protein
MQAYPGVGSWLALALALALVLVPLFINKLISCARRETLSPVLLAPWLVKDSSQTDGFAVGAVWNLQHGHYGALCFVLKTRTGATTFLVLFMRSVYFYRLLQVCCRSGLDSQPSALDVDKWLPTDRSSVTALNKLLPYRLG